MENLHLKNLKNNGKITIKKITRYFDKQHIQIFPNENGYQKDFQTKMDIKKQGISLVMFIHHHNQQKFKNGLIIKP